MKKEDLIKLKQHIAELSEEEKKQRDLYLRDLALGKIQGPTTGYATIDKPWLKHYDEEAILSDVPKMSCYDYLRECNKDYLDRYALSYFKKRITFRQMLTKIDLTANALYNMGLRKGDCVTISLPNIPEAVYLFYACSKIGVVANMIDPRTSSDGIEKYIKEVNSKYVFMIDSYFNKLDGLLKKEYFDKAIVVSPAESLPFVLSKLYNLKNKPNYDKNNERIINWSEFITNYCNNTVIDSDFIENQPLVIEHTGGTTGAPKGVILTNENINAVALQSVLTRINMKREHNWLDIMPTFIAYGVGMGLHLPLTIGMETLLIPQFDPKKFDELVLKNKANHMVGVPSYWGTITESVKMKNKDLSFIIAPTVGGDAMDLTLEKQSNDFLKKHNCGYAITKGYGMTEVSGGISGTLEEHNELGSVGCPFVKSNIGIFTPSTDEELQIDEKGEVCMTGPNVMLGYFNNPEATSGVLKMHSDGRLWIHSGDIGYINKDGSLFIVDRIKRMIIRYDGFKIYPSIIENIISSHCAVESCKVVGISDLNHSQGKLPKAHIVLKKDYHGVTEEVIDEIRKMCDIQLPEYAVPVDYKVRDTMPLTQVGKIDYRFLEEEDEKEKSIKRDLIK